METFFEEIRAWEVVKMGKFSSSEYHKLMQSPKSKKDGLFGKGALTYINEKLSELLTGQPVRDLTGMRQLEWGLSNEYEGITSIFESGYDLTGIEIYGGSNPQFYAYNSYSGGSPDALSDIYVIEAKCPYKSAIHVDNLRASKRKGLKDWMIANRYDYYVQIQGNLMACKKEKSLFVSFDPRMLEPKHKTAIIEVEADFEIQDELKMRLEKAAEIVSDTLELLNKH